MTATATESVKVERPSGGPLGWLKRNLQLILGLLISGWSISQLARDVDIGKVAAYLESLDLVWLLVCAVSIPVTMLVKCIRWRYLFPEGVAPPLGPLVSSLYIGYFFNTILPARVGELVRAFLIGRYKSVGTPVALGTVVLEKILDLITLGLILATLVLANLLPTLPDWMMLSARTTAAGLVLGVLALMVMLLMRRRVIALLAAFEGLVPVLIRLRLPTLASSFLDGLAGLGRRGTLPGLLLWSVLVWCASTFTMWTGLAGAGITPGLSATLLALVVTNLGMAVPSAPGYVGVFHYLVVESLDPFGVDRSHALAAAIIMHTIVFGNFIVGGFWCLWRGGYRLDALRDAASH